MSGHSPEQEAKSDEVGSSLLLAVPVGSSQSAEVLAELSALRVLLLKQQQLIETQQKQLGQQAEEIAQLKCAMTEKVDVKALLPFFEEQKRREEAEVEQKRHKAEELQRVYARKLRVSPSFMLHSSSPLLARSAHISEVKGNPKEVEALLRRVAYGEQKEAESMIQRKPELLLCKGKVTDLSKREFKEITAFQYAVWALDWHMWRMLLKYLAEEEAALQWQELETRGTAHEKQANWQGLIDAYTSYIPLAIAAEAAGWRGAPAAAAQSHLIKQIGGEQLLLPVHVVNEYCHGSRAFNSLPDFRSEAVELTRSRRSGGVDWYYVVDWYDVRCGVEWAYYRSGCSTARSTTPLPGGGTHHSNAGGTACDKEAVAALLETRLRQRVELGKRLEPVLRLLTIHDALDSHFPAPLVSMVQAYDGSPEVPEMSM